MELTFADTRDQALVALAIQKASAHSAYLGRTAVQKIVYFLKVADVPMDYRFEIYHYGPFSDALRSDIGWLLADEVISDRSDDPSTHSNYVPGPAFENLMGKYRDDLAHYENTIQAVVSALPLSNSKQMEMIATLDYLYRATKASHPSGPYRDTVISRFQEVKGEKFTKTDIECAYDDMMKAKLFAA
jgi:hypothetical protein